MVFMIVPNNHYGPIVYRLGRQVFILESSVRFRVGLQIGLVVQLVRIHACHAWGREFESRPDRKRESETVPFFYLCMLLISLSL